MENRNSFTTLRDVQENDALIESILESGRIGQLCRNGRTMFYAVLQPGQYVEGATRLDVARKLLAYANR